MKRQLKKVFFVMFFVASCFLFLSINHDEIEAIEYINEKGEIKNTYDKVDVFSFKYDYISKFTEQSGFYKGEDVFDGKSLRDEYFYSGASIEIKLDHKTGLFKSDSISIYRYSEQRKDFTSKYKVFASNDEATKNIDSYVLNQEGIYKISYVNDGEVRNKEYYIYICSAMQKASVKGKAEYSNMPVFSYFDFELDLMDGYNLKNNTYYYAFAVDDSNLKFEKLDMASKLSQAVIYELENFNVTIEIKDSDKCKEGEKKFLYIKIVRPELGETIIVTNKAYNLSSSLGASVVLLDKEGNDAEGVMYYKRGDVIKGELRFNSPVTFSYLEMSLNGRTFFPLSNATEEVKKVDFEWEVNESQLYSGGVKFSTRNNPSGDVIVNHKGLNVKLSIDKGHGYFIDVAEPLVNIGGDTVYGATKNSYSVVLTIHEQNIETVLYYVDKCSIVQENVCAESFNDNNPNMISLSKDVIEEGTELNVFTHEIIIDESLLGKKINGENLLLYVKAIDKAGNSALNSKYGYKLDTIIVTENVEDLFVERDIFQESNVVGKQMVVSVLKGYSVAKVSYHMLGMDEYATCFYMHEGDEKKDTYSCFEVKDEYLNSDVKIKINDLYGNEEIYSTSFRYSNLEDEIVEVDGYTLKLYKDNYYDIEIASINNVIYEKGEKVAFSGDFMNQIRSLLGIDSISALVEFVYYDGENVEVLINGIGEEFELPTNYEILKIINKEEKYNECVLKGETCNLDVYLRYIYTLGLKGENVSQNRLVKLNFIDGALRFGTEGFISRVDIEVFSKYEKVEYKIYDNLNNELNKDLVTSIAEIKFKDLDGQTSVVDAVDTSKLGVYTIVERVQYGEIESYPLEYFVEVKDTKAPSIKLVGNSILTIRKGQGIGEIKDFVDVYDEYDENLPVLYSWDKKFNPDEEGEYVLSIWTVDSSGNKSEIVMKTIVVDNSGAVVTYLLAGGIILFTVLVILIGVKREKKKERKK